MFRYNWEENQIINLVIVFNQDNLRTGDLPQQRKKQKGHKDLYDIIK